MTPVTAALEVVENAVLAALGALVPTGAAFWNAEATSLYSRLALPPPTPTALACAWIAQHQDNGGQRDPRVNSHGWRGLVVVRCLSRTQATARAGLQSAVPVMAALAPPTGYTLNATWDRPIAIPKSENIYTAAGQWIVTIRTRPL